LINQFTSVLLLGVIAVLAVAVALKMYRMGVQAAMTAVALALGAALVVYGVHSTWEVNLVARANATELLLPQRTALDVQRLADDVAAAARKQGDLAVTITLDDRLRQPLRWYLRDYLSVTTARTGASTKSVVVIAPAEAKDAMQKALGTAYVSQRYRVAQTFNANAPVKSWLRWAHVREPVAPLKTTDVYAFYKLPQ
jgi:hypothetical protein